MGLFLFTLFALWAFIEARAWHIRSQNRLRRQFGQPEKPYLSVIWFKDSQRF